MKTVLVTAVGSASAHWVVESLHRQGFRAVCCDIYPREWNAVPMEADAFFQSVPATSGEAYIDQMKEAARREHCDFLIPLTDPEVDVLAPRRAEFAALGCTVCVPDLPCTLLCRDKKAMAEHLAPVCRVIPTHLAGEWEPDSYPVILKPIHGRSSQAQHIASDAAEYHTFAALRDDYIAQPFLRGDILCVDVARDAQGNVQALARQELLRTGNGLGTTVRVMPGHELEKVCADIAAAIGLVGVVNMEFISDGESYSFLEVNPRFSGGVGFSGAAGCDFVSLNLCIHQGLSVGARPLLKEAVVTRSVAPLLTLQGDTLA